MSVEALLPEQVRVPFSNYDLWNSQETSGLLQGHSEGLTLEFEVIQHVKDSLWPEVESKSGVKQLTIPLEEIESLEFIQGWIQAKIVLKTAGMKRLEEIPGNKQGQVHLTVADKDRDAAKEVVSVMGVRLSERRLEVMNRRNSPAEP